MSTLNLVSCLMNHGKSLAKQLDKAKAVPKPSEENIYDEVEKLINGLINDLDKLDDEEFTTKQCFDKVAGKTISSLEELKKHDDPQYATRYDALVDKVGKFCLSTDVSPTVTASTPTHNNNYENDIVEDNNNSAQDTHLNFKDLYQSLNPDHKSLLKLFAILPRGTHLKKNDLILWWCGSFGFERHLNPIKDNGEESDFEKHLRKLVEMKMIEPVVVGCVESVGKNNKRESVKYKMPNVIWSKFQDNKYNKYVGTKFKKRNYLFVSHNGSGVNTDACNLTTERLNMFTKEDDILKMQLGNWKHDPTKYIVVEDVDSLSKVLNWYPLIFLSLEGVSGLITLPCFNGEYLKILNLKGCHNLESLPQFNKMPRPTKKLEYLDVSECYQLDHLANVLDGCIELRVVKGFVLPRQQDDPRNSFISNPSQFEHLWKLTLRTRRLNFPTKLDLETLCELQSLTHLKITWVGACSPDNNNREVVQFDESSKFPPKLTKFEMEAASDDTATKILDLIAQKKKTTPIPLKKLYIKGGNLSNLNPEVDCKILRLHYLPKMEFTCYDMMKSFPKLHRLEMSRDVMYSMLRRSFQKATGTDDQTSGWAPSLNPPTISPSAS